jgi:DDE family transposase
VEITEGALAKVCSVVMPHLDERQRRILAGALARAAGRGGVGLVATVSGMSRSTVQDGAREVDRGVDPSARVRRPGAGRPRLTDRDPTLLADLDALVEPESRGDPMCPLRWTVKSTTQLAQALVAMGHQVSPDTVGALLHSMGYRLQATTKQIEGTEHPDRDAQFRYLHTQVQDHLAAAQPVISVDTTKKELVGTVANKGREWQPTGQPVRVQVHDFPDPVLGKAVPYGIYDLAANEGWVGVGDDNDTAAFAVHTIGRWWDMVGSKAYPDATRLLVTADAGGSNGYRNRLWKRELAALADRAGLDVTVCHLPPGTSKWNKIEHRLFSAISLNWRARPLTSHQVIVDLIAATSTRTGLKVRAELDQGDYPKATKVTDEELAALPLTEHEFHGKWNYTVRPRSPATTTG